MTSDLRNHLEKLYHFHKILEQGSLQATSRNLGVSAATLSYSVRILEEVTQVQLLIRSKKGVEVTPAGQRLKEYCKKLYFELDQLGGELHDLNFQSQRKVRIGTFSSIAIYFWPLLLRELGSQSHLSFSLITKRSLEILEALVKHEVDVAITVATFSQGNLKSHELYQDDYAFYAASKARGVFDHGRISQETLLYIPDATDDEGKKLSQYVHGSNLHFKEIFELDSFEVISEFIKKGYGIGILPRKVAKNIGPGLKAIKLENFPEKFGNHKFYLSYRRDLDMQESQLRLILDAAEKAVPRLHS